MRALVVGDLMVVVAGRVEQMPRSGQNVVMTGAAVHATGVAANVAFCLRSLGVDVTVASAVGRDALGDTVLAELSGTGVDVSQVARRADATTATMLVMVEPAGERTMVGTRGASERFDLQPLALLDAVRPDWVHVSGYTLLDPLMTERCERLVDGALTSGARCSVDLEGVAADRAGRTGPLPLERALAFCNLDEYRDAFGRAELMPVDRSAPLVVKAGRDGAYVIDGEAVTHVPTVPVMPTDSTGAGDAFDAAFISASLRGRDLVEACRWGNAAGALAAAAAGPRLDLARRPGPWTGSGSATLL